MEDFPHFNLYFLHTITMESNTVSNSNQHSKYLKTIVCPWMGPSEIPDFDMTTSHLKSVTITQTVTVPNNSSGTGLFVYQPHSKDSPVQFWVWSTADSRFYFREIINYDQDLSDNFTYGRFISGGLKVISATTSGTAFNVSGITNATAFQEPPDIKTLTFNNITAYKRSDTDVASSVPIDQGIISLGFPDGDQQFTILRDSDNYYSSSMAVTRTFHVQGDASPGWNNVMGVNFFLFDTNGAPGFIPPNSFDVADLYISIELDFPNGLGVNQNPQLIVHNSFPTIGADWLTVTPNIASEAHFMTYNDSTSVKITWDFVVNITSLPGPYERLQIQYVGAVAPSGCGRGKILLHQPTYYEKGIRGPGSFIGFDKVGFTQMISIGGVSNLEVVPDASLSKNITTSGPGSSIFSPVEMQLVMSYLANASSYGLKQIWTWDEYEMWKSSLKYEKHTSIANLAQAAGWTDFINTVTRHISPLIKPALTMAGTALGGPIGGQLASTLGNLIIQPPIGSSALYKYNPGQAKSHYGRSALLGGPEYQDAVATAINIRQLSFGEPSVIPSTIELHSSPKDTYDNMMSGQVGMILNQEVPTDFGANMFPIVLSNGTVEYGYVFYDAHAPVLFSPGLMSYPVTMSGTQTGFNVIFDTPIFNNNIWKDHVAGLLGTVVPDFVKGFITIYSSTAFVEHSFLAAVTISLLGITLPLPVTGAIINLPDGGTKNFMAAELQHKINSSPTFIMCEPEDAAMFKQEIPLAEPLDLLIAQAQNGALWSGAIPISDNKSLSCIRANFGFRRYQRCLEIKFSKIITRAPSEFDPAEAIKFFETHDIDTVQVFFGEENNMEEYDEYIPDVFNWWKNRDYQKVEGAEKMFKNTIDALEDKMKHDLNRAIKTQNLSRALSIINSLANVKVQIQMYTGKGIPKKQQKLAPAAIVWPEFKGIEIDGEDVSFDDIQEFIESIDSDWPPLLKKVQAIPIKTIKDKFQLLKKVWGGSNLNDYKQAESLSGTIGNLYTSLTAAEKKGTEKANKFKSTKGKVAIKQTGMKKPGTIAPTPKKKGTMTKGETKRIQPKVSVKEEEEEEIPEEYYKVEDVF